MYVRTMRKDRMNMIQGDVGFCFDLDVPKHFAFLHLKSVRETNKCSSYMYEKIPVFKSLCYTFICILIFLIALQFMQISLSFRLQDPSMFYCLIMMKLKILKKISFKSLCTCSMIRKTLTLTLLLTDALYQGIEITAKSTYRCTGQERLILIEGDVE